MVKTSGLVTASQQQLHYILKSDSKNNTLESQTFLTITQSHFLILCVQRSLSQLFSELSCKRLEEYSIEGYTHSSPR